ncbi:Hint domain-containing protein [Roseovarius aestuariivivens]|uniref:Hint domain-containing protein n=1 Tax=Roseovarius aestuariivivens TaxID=1888910 RepID=UPI00108064D2|nr:Hint domain-containing protein [Roseovarius aestuariivivens]
MRHPTEGPAYSVPVYAAADLTVVNGANLGDPISFAAELDLDDTYELRLGARLHRLSVGPGDGETLRIAAGTRLGTPGATVHLDACLTLMSATGQTTEMLILVEVDDTGDVDQVYALPLAQISARTGYSLVGIDTETARQKFAEVACVSFTRGTHITLASGAQRPIEELNVGDAVLTRDDGVQKVRWIGQSTVRAVGEFAPIRIRAGTLHNANDLLVSPDHRLFIYQRSDALGAGRPELLVRARHLVNGDTVVQEDGGFVDYFQLLFDTHQIIYAEGIAAETLLLDTRTRAALPRELGEKLAQALPGHSDRAHLGFEVSEALLKHPDAAKLLKAASTR